MVLGPDQELPRQQIPEFTLNVMNQNLWSVETRNLFLKISSDSEDYISLRTNEVDETTQCVGMGGSEGMVINGIGMGTFVNYYTLAMEGTVRHRSTIMDCWCWRDLTKLKSRDVRVTCFQVS